MYTSGIKLIFINVENILQRQTIPTTRRLLYRTNNDTKILLRIRSQFVRIRIRGSYFENPRNRDAINPIYDIFSQFGEIEYLSYKKFYKSLTLER